MARDFTAASSQYLESSGSPITAEPLTMACWFNADNATAIHPLMAVQFDATVPNDVDGFRLNAQGTTAGDPVRAITVSNNNGSAADTSTGYTAGTWHHACGVWASASSRAVFIDGGSKATNTATRTINDTPDVVWAGRFERGDGGGGTNFLYADALVAEAAIWNVVLTDAEVAELALGVSPLQIRPESLVSYWPLIGRHSPEIDIVGGFDLTITGAVVADHTRMFYPRHSRVIPSAAAVAAAPPTIHLIMAPYIPA